MSDDLAAAIALTPGLAERLLADHVDDGRGRCRRCTLGGQSGHHRWPCRLHDIAARSLALAAHRDEPGARSASRLPGRGTAGTTTARPAGGIESRGPRS